MFTTLVLAKSVIAVSALVPNPGQATAAPVIAPPPPPAVLVVLVREGDTLTAIGARYRVSWPRIFNANARIRHPDRIYPGQKLVIPPKGAHLAARHIPAPAVVVTSARQWQAQAAPAGARVNPSISSAGSSGGRSEASIIAAESGGDPNVMNSSGHYGLYQFDYSTWVSGGGNPATFGHASTAEQHQVYLSVHAARGDQPWIASAGR